MHGKQVCLLSCALALGLAGSVSAELAGYWNLDERVGNVIHDRSGNGNHGTIHGATWEDGYYEAALLFDGADDYVEVPNSDSLEMDAEVSVSAWINWTDAGDGWLAILANGQQNGPWENYGLFVNRAGRFVYFTLSLDGGHVTQQTPNDAIESGSWHHVAATWDGSAARVYVDGQMSLEQAQAGTLVPPGLPLRIGHRNGSAHYYNGSIDEVAVLSHALTQQEVQEAMLGFAAAELAADPSPENEATDVPRDLGLSWAPGEFADTHDVYLGTSFDDVNAADRTDPRDVLLSQGQSDTTYDLGRLEFGQTYYWRIDEVNAPPDSTIFKGEVWTFTVEPFAYPIPGVVATSNGTSEAGVGPENTINGSGLNESDEHSTASTDMWLAVPAADPLQVQYDFGRLYKLHEMLVWNYNVQFELMLGFGLKDVTVEYSENGADWTPLGDVQLAQATARADYTANTVVDFGGVAVQSIRLTVNSAYGIMGQFGLSEVRLLFIPVHAREPQPADAESDVAVNVTLDWRAGREAATHDVYLGTSADALSLVETVGATNYTPADLQFGTAYYWRVDEVNEVEAISLWAGDLWNFTAQEFAAIDDFESYDDEDNRIFDAWLDGFVNNTGSTVGYFEAPFAEQTIVNSGGQSMPLEYNNADAPFYSEAELDLGSADWTTNGADTLRLFVAGQAPSFLETADGAIIMNAIGTDIWDSADEFRYAYKTLTGDGSMVARVDALDGAPSTWAKAGVMVRQSTAGGSTHSFMCMTGGDGNGASWQGRLTDNASSENTDATSAVAPPYWVRIDRAGDSLTGFISPDGETWTQLGDARTIAMADPVLIGLALTSHNANMATSAVFSNVSMTGSGGDVWQVAEIGVAQPEGNIPEALYVAIEDTSGNVAVVTHPDPGATAVPGWNEWLIPYSDLAGVNLSRVAIMYIGVGDRDNPTAGGTGLLFIDDVGYGHPAAGE